VAPTVEDLGVVGAGRWLVVRLLIELAEVELSSGPILGVTEGQVTVYGYVLKQVTRPVRPIREKQRT
jgi:hypothetical protein